MGNIPNLGLKIQHKALLEYPKINPEYIDTFVQRLPSYAVKLPGKSWRTKKKSLCDKPIQAHLDGKYAVAVVGQWYPKFAALDIDDAPLEKVFEVQAALGLDEGNSLICPSASKDSYHVLFRPHYNDKPPTLALLKAQFSDFCTEKKIELYPQSKRAFRLPFGHGQNPILYDSGYEILGLENQLYEFQRLGEFDLAAIPRSQCLLSLDTPPLAVVTSGIAGEYLEHGLQATGTRHYAQFEILLSLWRKNIPVEQAVTIVWNWIQTKHNGFSKDFPRHPKAVLAEIQRQANLIFGRYDMAKTFPDSTHNCYLGYVSKPDMSEAIKVSGGSLPRLKFLAELIRYCNPRRQRPEIQVHSDKLISWSSKDTYLKRLAELEALGIVERGDSYEIGVRSKAIKVTWPWKTSSDAILLDGRSADPKAAIKHSFVPEEFREQMKAAGAERTAAIKATKAIFEM